MEEGESRCVGQGWIRTDGDLLIRGVAEIRRDAQGIGWTTGEGRSQAGSVVDG